MSASSLSLGDPTLVARLRRAREDRGISQQDAAESLRVARTTLVAIEKGERRLRAEELLEMADLYRVRLDDLLRAAPAPRDLAAQFRTAFGRLPDGAELRAAATELQALAEDYVELELLLHVPLGERHPPPRPLPAAGDVERVAAIAADEERGRLRLGDGPLPHLREILENDVGLRIFSLRLPARIGGLFGFDDELGACIAINALQPWERQRWSLTHEYAHFLTRRERNEVTVLVELYQRVPLSERFADAFARHFLLPAAGVTRRHQAAAAKAGRITPALLVEQADYWGVSFQAYVLRLEELGLVKAGLHDRLSKRGFKITEGRQLLGLPAHAADEVLLPRRFRLLAAEAFADELISEERLMRMLRVDRLAARESVARLLGSVDEDDHAA